MKAEFYYNRRKYSCSLAGEADSRELRIRNSEGKVLAIAQGAKTGLLGVCRQEAETVDVSQPRFYNLIKVALSALEVEEKRQLVQDQEQIISDKDQIIQQKDEQIAIIKQQLGILNQKLNQLSGEQQQQLQDLQLAVADQESQIREREAHLAQLQAQLKQPLPQFDPAKLERIVRTKLGELTWNSISSSSQQDLCTAYEHYKLIGAKNFIDDYTEAGLRLGFVIETEIVSPFFAKLYQFLATGGGNASYGNSFFELGGLTLKPNQEYTLGMLPRLLSNQWETYRSDALEQCSPPDKNKLHRTIVLRDALNHADSQQIKRFLRQWQHPLAQWLGLGEVAASTLDQITKLRNRAAHPVPLYLWQFKKLWFLVVGGKTRRGLLGDIYDRQSLS
ncbi:hypothetical protein [Leptolyngbya sp. FACHB-261]|uniref:hypothetical protein n=1 Tax=Leptolyngbya sp. FACHB-261 TaxID=2692806 RepID=UPI00168246B1|nr:hypothetical protein [Leptolyngbya sp. FACHB-261]MBD2100664.1 hypothetical protein [Leptolyngbya sp. FACHB-261]